MGKRERESGKERERERVGKRERESGKERERESIIEAYENVLHAFLHAYHRGAVCNL